MALRISGDGSLNYLDVTLDNVTASGLSASGNVVLPSTTEIGAVSSTELGYVDGVTSAIQTQLNTLDSDLASKLDLAGGKILQVVRATSSTSITITATSFTDVTDMSVTITPQKNTSAIFLLANFRWQTGAASGSGQSTTGYFQITDSSNNAISGAENMHAGIASIGVSSVIAYGGSSLIAYATPATTSAVTYKLRGKTDIAADPLAVQNANNTGEMYAIEVSA